MTNVKKSILALYILMLLFAQLQGSEDGIRQAEEKIQASTSVQREYHVPSLQTEALQTLSSTNVYGAFDHLTVNNNDERRWLLQTQAGNHILNEIIIQQNYREITIPQIQNFIYEYYPGMKQQDSDYAEQATDFNTRNIDNEPDIAEEPVDEEAEPEEKIEIHNYTTKQTGKNNHSAQTQNGGAGHIANVIQNGAENSAVQSQSNGFNNSASIHQVGNHNTAVQTQYHAKLSNAEIVQSGNNNQATQEQQGEDIITGWHNRAVVNQEGNEHSALQIQTGVGRNRAEIYQDGGKGYTAGQTQNGAMNRASVTQQGDGKGHSSTARQEGIGNTAGQSQTGGRSFTATIEQTKNRNNAIQVQEGTNFFNFYSGVSEVYIHQNGNNNRAEQIQSGGLQSNQIIIQSGGENAARQYQQRTKFNTAEIIQTGNGNQAEQMQSSGRILSDWRNTAVIHQTGNENRATQMQSGAGGNHAVVRQTGSNNTAEQTQSGWLNRSTVEQNGDNNVAVVRQRS